MAPRRPPRPRARGRRLSRAPGPARRGLETPGRGRARLQSDARKTWLEYAHGRKAHGMREGAGEAGIGGRFSGSDAPHTRLITHKEKCTRASARPLPSNTRNLPTWNTSHGRVRGLERGAAGRRGRDGLVRGGVPPEHGLQLHVHQDRVPGHRRAPPGWNTRSCRAAQVSVSDARSRAAQSRRAAVACCPPRRHEDCMH